MKQFVLLLFFLISSLEQKKNLNYHPRNTNHSNKKNKKIKAKKSMMKVDPTNNENNTNNPPDENPPNTSNNGGGSTNSASGSSAASGSSPQDEGPQTLGKIEIKDGNFEPSTQDFKPDESKYKMFSCYCFGASDAACPICDPILEQGADYNEWGGVGDSEDIIDYDPEADNDMRLDFWLPTNHELKMHTAIRCQSDSGSDFNGEKEPKLKLEEQQKKNISEYCKQLKELEIPEVERDFRKQQNQESLVKDEALSEKQKKIRGFRDDTAIIKMKSKQDDRSLKKYQWQFQFKYTADDKIDPEKYKID